MHGGGKREVRHFIFAEVALSQKECAVLRRPMIISVKKVDEKMMTEAL